MYTRLAFSVAAHLEPDVLIVDEVLAVGDISFQARCLAKMQEVSEGGRTVFFVSHMMHAISKLCKRVMLIDGGRVVVDGPAEQVVSDYMQRVVGTTGTKNWAEPTAAPGTGAVRLRSVRVRLEDGQVTDSVDIGQPVAIEMQFDVLQPGLVLVPGFQFFNRQGTCLFVSDNPKLTARSSQIGRYTSTCWIPGNLLAEGTVMATAVICSADPPIMHIYEHQAVAFEVTDHTTTRLLQLSYTGPYPGVVRPALDWTTDMATLPEGSALYACRLMRIFLVSYFAASSVGHGGLHDPHTSSWSMTPWHSAASPVSPRSIWSGGGKPDGMAGTGALQSTPAPRLGDGRRGASSGESGRWGTA